MKRFEVWGPENGEHTRESEDSLYSCCGGDDARRRCVVDGEGGDDGIVSLLAGSSVRRPCV